MVFDIFFIYSEMRKLPIALLVAVGLLAGLINHAKADTVFDLTWSGASFGNDASATGFLDLDLASISNPGVTHQSSAPFVTDFGITITGASSGNGTFNYSDFNGGDSTFGGFYIDTGGAVLDFASQFIGQLTPNGSWGIPDSNNGDFNFFNNGNDETAPDGTFYFTLTTSDGDGDQMLLTSFAPETVSATPEPTTAILMTTALMGFVLFGRRTIRSRQL